VAVVAALLLYLELAWPPFYAFPSAQPFSGEQWYQPYAGYRGGGLLANFHAHTRAWGGLTYGEVSAEVLRGLYAERGYDVIGISDYMSIVPAAPGDPLYLSAYEHGYTVGRRHQTVIGAERVDWFDYPLGGSTRHKQSVIDALRPDAAYLVLNHLGKAGAYSLGDLAVLTGYDAIEVSSKYGISADYWDAALSTGRPVWGMASDDGHEQASRRSHLGIGAVVIHAEERTPRAVLRALRAGRFHSLRMRKNEPPIALVRCEIESGELVVELGERADSIRFTSAHGALRHEARGVSSARYRLADGDPYVRVEADARGARLYLNPMLRWDGVALPSPRAELRTVPTWTARALGAIALSAALLFIGRRARRGRGTARSPSPAPVLPPKRLPETGRAAPRA